MANLVLPYRPEIDGLRAVAVMMVVFYHAGLAELKGGYIGVDVFFVISGYLITSIIWADYKRGVFSYANFYERRARRILPALYLVAILSAPVGWYMLSSSEYSEFAQSLLAIPTFVSNFFFWFQSGYFSTEAELKPMLHTWSIAVEEQFYFLFPMLLLSLAAIGRRTVLFVSLGLLLAFSLVASEYMVSRYSGANFFLLPTRLWELLIGATLALAIAHARSPTLGLNTLLANIVSAVGLAMVIWPAIIYTSDTPFPGISAVVPTIGTGLIIYAARPGTFVHWLLSQPIIVSVGLFSYSIYLWHQPMFAFVRTYWGNAFFDDRKTEFIVVALIVGWFSWQFIEKPFRDRSWLTRKQIFSMSILGAVVIVGLGVLGGIIKPRIQFPSQLDSSFARTDRDRECFDLDYAHKEGKRWHCRLGVTKKVSPSFLLFGDSHALSFLPAFETLADQTGRTGLFTGFSGCPPILNVRPHRKDQGRRNCHELNAKVLAEAKAIGIKTVFLSARWAYYTTGGYRGSDDGMIFVIHDHHPILPPGRWPSANESRTSFAKGLKETVAAYRSAGIEVVLLQQVPQQRDLARHIYVKAFRSGGNIDRKLAQYSVSQHDHTNMQAYSRYVLSVVAEANNIEVIGFDDFFCRRGRCPVGNARVSYYMDDDHLSVSGSHALVDLLLPRFKAAFNSASQVTDKKDERTNADFGHPDVKSAD